MNYFIINREQLSRDGNTYELQGYQYGSTNISLILVDVPPGEAQSCMFIPMKRSLSSKKAVPPIRLVRQQSKRRQGKLRLSRQVYLTSSSIPVLGAYCKWTSTTAHVLSLSGLKTSQDGSFLS
jgi:hypothetical protein